MKTNKLFSTIMAAALCLSALSAQAFADDILSESIYVENGADLTKGIESAHCEKFAGGKVYIDADSVTPLYTADFIEYAKTGEFVVELKGLKDNEKWYVANGKDADGNTKGIFEFYVGAEYSGLTGYYNGKIDFQADSKRIKDAMTSKGISTDCKEIKLVSVENIGYVYYIDNGESKYLAASGIGEKDKDIFNDQSVIEIGSELKAIADKKLKKIEEDKKNAQNSAGNSVPVENPPTGGDENPPTAGGDTPDENPPTLGGDSDANKNPATGYTGVALAGGLILATCGVIVSKTNKKNKH